MTTIRKARIARKAHDCWYCRRHDHKRGTIQPGQTYLTSALVPGSDLGNEHWLHSKECAGCAVALGRGEHLGIEVAV